MPSFDQILGQSAAIDMLRGALAADRLPHGLIFAGPPGVGKGLTASALAQVFLCERAKARSACGACASCRLIAAGNHPDFHIIYRQLARIEKKDRVARDLVIDVIRKFLLEPAALTAAMGRGKVFVVEEADLMNPQAQNALLKTLEEPAGRTLIILLVEKAQALLPTLRSRCQGVQFASLPPDAVANILSGKGIVPDKARRAAATARGSAGVALRWLEDGVIDKAAELEERLDALLAGRSAGDFAIWLKGAAEAYAAAQAQRDPLNSKDAGSRDGIVIHLSIASDLLRARLRAESSADRLEAVCAAIDALAQSEVYTDANVTISLICQQLAATLDRLFAAAGA